MKAMIFAAGLGTRLKPYTLHHPKALVPVAGVTMLERVIIKLKAAGIDEFVVNVHHFAQQIIDFLNENDNFGCTIHISDETALLLDTGGGILAARRWLEGGTEPFIVHNADILTDLNIEALINAHINGRALATLAVSERSTSRYLLMDSDMYMRGWTNVTTGQVRPSDINARLYDKYAFGGIHVISPQIFTFLDGYRPTDIPFSIMDFYIDKCTELPIKGYNSPNPYFWHDIGKLQTLAEAEKYYR